ncbi:hypothetical protein [Hymenobacter bucti]|uniref:Uncharacterized protein n=1 Tax=Hymenobacter bucti TaxID=1844114 RepID=A0ABW4QPQ5_9BACT
MKNLTLSLGRITLVLATAFSLGACGRADYAPISSATTQPASTPIAQAAPYVPVAGEASATVKSITPTQAAPATPLAVQPTPAAPEVAPVASAAAPVAPAIAAAPQTKAAAAPKLNLGQRLALRKITKKLDKLASHMPQLKQRDASAARGGLDGNLRSALLFGLIGIILLLFSGVSNIFGILGTILLIIGLVFLVLWLLDQA